MGLAAQDHGRRTSPDVDDERALTILRERSATLHASFELRLRGGPRYLLEIDSGTAATSLATSATRADCWISADPEAFLKVGFGWTGQWGQIARGKLLAGGRKPWRTATFGSLITGPCGGPAANAAAREPARHRSRTYGGRVRDLSAARPGQHPAKRPRNLGHLPERIRDRANTGLGEYGTGRIPD